MRLTNTILRNEEGAAGASGIALGDGETAAPEPAPGGEDSGPDSLYGSLFDESTHTLRDGWQDVARDRGLPDAAISHLGRQGFGGQADAILKSALHLAALPGQKIEQWSDGEVDALSESEKNMLVSKLTSRPETAEGYNFELEAIGGQDRPEGFDQHWGELAPRLGLSQAQVEGLVTGTAEWMGKVQADHQQSLATATEASQREITEHFQAEWGEDYPQRKAVVEQWVSDHLDLENNPLHQAMVNDKQALELIARDAMGIAQGRREGSLPSEDNASPTGQTWDQQYEDFQKEHGGGAAWRMAAPEVVKRGNYLARMAAEEANRRAR